MDNEARTLLLEPTEAWLAVEYDLPRTDRDAGGEEQAAAERERYDEQIYAALVDPSF